MVQLVKPDPADSNFQCRRGGRMLTPSLDGLPLTKPHARVTALDLNDGTLAWPSPVGEGPPPETRKLHVFDLDTGAHLRAIEPPVPGPMPRP